MFFFLIFFVLLISVFLQSAKVTPGTPIISQPKSTEQPTSDSFMLKKQEEVKFLNWKKRMQELKKTNSIFEAEFNKSVSDYTFTLQRIIFNDFFQKGRWRWEAIFKWTKNYSSVTIKFQWCQKRFNSVLLRSIKFTWNIKMFSTCVKF